MPGVFHKPVNKPSEQADWAPPTNFGESVRKAEAPERESQPNYALWSVTRPQLRELLAAWAGEAAGGVRGFLEQLAATEVPKGWALWALTDPEETESGGGFYLMPPGEPQAIVFLEPVDQYTNNIHHVAVSPAAGPGVREAVNGWLKSLKPKKAIICRPEELVLFGLELTAEGGAGSTSGTSGGTTVSKGL